ncbi:hypothetical protein KIW84_011519 [Lathyrus oleraceus]|uniref:WAT1-related protein n=1 Tax=Pisum sativum TaxID=3888 RepID=A0A9D5BF65_PEA|nr:hypothetical protein KIW84_011519 [Pisum sativum]
MDRRCCNCYKDLLPFMVLVGNECIITGVYTLFKAATLQGMSKYVFVAYSYTVSTILLLPFYFFYTRSVFRSRVVPKLSFSILFKIALLGVVGCSAQFLAYAGISYSSPTLSSAIGNLIPAFTFILAVICRMEKIAIKSRTTQAKVWGSIISISGAFIVTFYKGKSITITHNSSFFHLQQPNHILTSVDTNWAIGGLLLTVSNILLTIWFVAQVHFLFANIEIYNRYFTLKMCLVSDICKVDTDTIHVIS